MHERWVERFKLIGSIYASVHLSGLKKTCSMELLKEGGRK
jgi:hypothetical protein